jgi:serine phosphatase RsbU (regulator of sigma subunit)
MRLLKKFALLILLSVPGFILNAQVNQFGTPIIRNYDIQVTGGSEQNWCIAKDKLGNVYFGTQEKGISQYDGTRWSSITVAKNSRIYSLATDERGVIYVGSAYEFGYLQPDEKGIIQYVSLSKRVDSIPEIKTIFSVATLNEKVYFLSAKIIYVYDTRADSLSKISLGRLKLVNALRLVNIDGRLILSDNKEGLFEIKDTLITPMPGGDFFKNKICMVLLQYDRNQVLVGTYNTGLFLYNVETGVVNQGFVNPDLNKRLGIALITAGTNLGNELFAIGTGNDEGMLIFDRSGSLVDQYTKDNSDLEDNTMYALYSDKKDKSELWISTLGVVSKAYPFTKKLNSKQGIGSAVNEICEFQGRKFLSTDDGVFESFIDKDGKLGFKKIEKINDQVFPLQVVKIKSDEFLLAGTQFGIVMIRKDGTVKNIEPDMYNMPVKRPPTNFKKILQSSINPEILYFGLESGGVLIFRYEQGKWKFLRWITDITGIVYSLVEKPDGEVWIVSDDPSALYSLSMKTNDTTLTKYGVSDGVPPEDLNSIGYFNNELYIATGKGIIRYDRPSGKFISDNSLTNGVSAGKYSRNLYMDHDKDIWYSESDPNNIEVLFNKSNMGETGYQGYHGILNLLPNAPSQQMAVYNDVAYFLKSKIIYTVEKASLIPDSANLNTFFVKINVGKDSTILQGPFYKSIDKNRRFISSTSGQNTFLKFGYDMNRISFEWTTPYFIEEQSTEYSYKLEGLDEAWSRWEGFSSGKYFKKEYNNLPFGSYTFHVRTRTITGRYAKELTYTFDILKPWYATVLAFIGFSIIAIVILFFIIKAYTKKLKNENIRLEGIVAERTAVVVKQKEELESSIHYASRIQMALLPSETILAENLKNYFILFKPRDIVSGDFYWMTKKNNRLYIVAADCTGHGVPGAFMSLLGMSFLDEIIDKEEAPRANHILSQLRLHVTESLKQIGVENEAKDGMDMALLVVDFNTSRIEFSGAYNPCFRVRLMTGEETRKYKEDNMEMPDGSMSNGKYLLETIYASKMPIGISSRMNEEFVFFDWNLERGISYYLFSDGYIDQFGGPDGRKFMKKNFKRLILEIQDFPLKKQKEILEQNLKSWMGQTPQIDDILVMGIRTE